MREKELDYLNYLNGKIIESLETREIELKKEKTREIKKLKSQLIQTNQKLRDTETETEKITRSLEQSEAE